MSGRAGVPCSLCGLPVTETAVTGESGDAFCCPGCRDVAATIDGVEGVDDADVREAVGAGGAEATPADHERAHFRVDGMHCATCEAFLETLAGNHEGVSGAESSYVTESVRVDYDPDQLSEAELAETLSTGRYDASRRAEGDRRADEVEGVPWRVAIGAMLAMYTMLPYIIYVYPVHFSLVYPDWMVEMVRGQLQQARYFFYPLLVMTSLVLFYTGKPLLRGALVSLRARRPNMDLLVSLAAVCAYLYSTLAVAVGRIDVYYDVTIVVVLVVSAGNYYKSRVKHEATERLADLTSTQVETAHRVRDDGTETVPVDDLDPGDSVLVRDGERVPVDGVVRESCAVDEAVVTGESLPTLKQPGDEVVGGSVVVDDAATVDVGEGARSSLDDVVDLVWNLQSGARGVQKLANRLAVVFVPTVLVLAAVAATVRLVGGAGGTAALLTALTVLIVSCPCALGLATPLAVASGVREALESGIVVFDETVFERLRNVDAVVFDKTGTLTTGRMAVREADAPENLLPAAAALERRSSHPAAAAIADAFGDGTRTDGGVSGERADAGTDRTGGVSDFRSHATGVEGVVDGSPVLVGHPDLFAERGWSVPERVDEAVAAARAAGDLPVVVGREGAAAGVVVVGDEPRADWAETVTRLSDRGVEVVVLTGDDAAAADRFRDHPDVDDVFAGVPPEGKAATVRRLGAGRQVAMVGDGTNDAPALAEADLGVALGSGTALAVDAADVAVVDDSLSSVETVFDLAGAAGRRVKENVGWAFLYNGVAIPLALAGHLNPLFAALAMVTSSVLVVLNSRRPLVGETA
jgi:Cu2+-exporting ATPase